MKNLEQIIEEQKAVRQEEGAYGIKECKKSISDMIDYNKKWNERVRHNEFETNLYVWLGKYVEQANTDVFFNKAMVLACWELINEQDLEVK